MHKNLSIFDEYFLEFLEENIQEDSNSINYQDKELENSTYLMTAASRGNIDLIRILLNKGGDIYVLNNRKYNILHSAISGARSADKCNDKEKVQNCCQIFGLLLIIYIKLKDY